MALTWAEFLKNHKDQDEYKKCSMEIAQLCNPKEVKIQVFTKMKEAQPFVVVSKNAVDGTAQCLFNF